MRFAVRLVSIALVMTATACAGGGMFPPTPEPEGRLSFDRNTSFDGETLRIEFDTEEGKETFNTVRDGEWSDAWSPRVPNRAGRNWTLVKATTEETSFVYALMSWDNDNPTDYLAIGYWLRFPSPLAWPFPPLSEAERRPFFDGPELDPSDPPRLPVAGTATYAGRMGGRFTYGREGTGTEAPFVAKEFVGTAILTADFADNTLSGCVGCIDDIEIDERAEHLRLQFFLARGFGLRRQELLAPPDDYEVHFGKTPIRRNGTFEHTDITVTHPSRTVTSTTGLWGGVLSNLPDADGNPRLVIGLSSVEFQEADGSEGKFEALFTAWEESLLPPGDTRD